MISGLERGDGEEKLTGCVKFSELGGKGSVAIVLSDEVLDLPVGTAAISLALSFLGGNLGEGFASRGLAGENLALNPEDLAEFVSALLGRGSGRGCCGERGFEFDNALLEIGFGHESHGRTG